MLIDSSGPVLVCALERAGEIIAESAGDPRGPDIAAAVAALCDERDQVSFESIVVGVGPGSFIGTRTAISFANGYAAASGIPLYGVNSLAAIAANHAGDVAVLRDARRGQWYLWMPDGECEVRSEAAALDELRAKGISRVVIETPLEPQIEARTASIGIPMAGGGGRENATPPPRVAVALNAAALIVSYVNSVPAAGLQRVAGSAETCEYVEPIYLRGFT